MRAIGDKNVIGRYVGDKQVIARYIGDKMVFADYITDGLIHRFDAIDNMGTGDFVPDANVWTDLVSGIQATMQNISRYNNAPHFNASNSKIFYSGQSVQAYTIINTHTILSLSGTHPRIFGENPYPTLYLHSGNNYSYGLYAHGADAPFTPRIIPPAGNKITVAMRFKGLGNPVELFINGTKAAQINVSANAGTTNVQYIGSRSDNTRTLNGVIYEHLVYSRPLEDDEIYHNYLVTKDRYGIE